MTKKKVVKKVKVKKRTYAERIPPPPPLARAVPPTGEARRIEVCVVDDLRGIAAETYMLELRDWESKRGQRGKRASEILATYHEDFLKLVRLLMSEEVLDYREYIAVQFRSRQVGNSPITPKQCHGAVSVERWHKHIGEAGKADTLKGLRLALQLQMAAYQRARARNRSMAQFSPKSVKWTDEDFAALALSDPDTSLSALFRYGMAKGLGLTEIVTMFRHQAFRQFMFARNGYTQMWGSLVPEELKAQAELVTIQVRELLGTETRHGKR